MLRNRSETYAESIISINESQTGFRKGYSTLDILLILHFFDSHLLIVKKSFTVPLSILNRPLNSILCREMTFGTNYFYGITGKCFIFIKNMYAGIKSNIRMNGMPSELFYCKLH